MQLRLMVNRLGASVRVPHSLAFVRSDFAAAAVGGALPQRTFKSSPHHDPGTILPRSTYITGIKGALKEQAKLLMRAKAPEMPKQKELGRHVAAAFEGMPMREEDAKTEAKFLAQNPDLIPDVHWPGLQAFIRKRGGEVHSVTIATVNERRGVFATSRILKGDPIAFIPSTAEIVSHLRQADEITELFEHLRVDLGGDEDARNQEITGQQFMSPFGFAEMTFRIIREASRGEKSKFWPYMRMLPKASEMHTCLYMSTDHIRAMDHTRALEECTTSLDRLAALEDIRKSAIRLRPDQFPPDVYTLPALRWAVSILESRSIDCEQELDRLTKKMERSDAFPIDFEEKDAHLQNEDPDDAPEHIHLTPLLDMINFPDFPNNSTKHGRDNVRLEVPHLGDKRLGMQIVAGRDIDAGEELFLNYHGDNVEAIAPHSLLPKHGIILRGEGAKLTSAVMTFGGGAVQRPHSTLRNIGDLAQTVFLPTKLDALPIFFNSEAYDVDQRVDLEPLASNYRFPVDDCDGFIQDMYARFGRLPYMLLPVSRAMSIDEMDDKQRAAEYEEMLDIIQPFPFVLEIEACKYAIQQIQQIVSEYPTSEQTDVALLNRIAKDFPDLRIPGEPIPVKYEKGVPVSPPKPPTPAVQEVMQQPPWHEDEGKNLQLRSYSSIFDDPATPKGATPEEIELQHMNSIARITMGKEMTPEEKQAGLTALSKRARALLQNDVWDVLRGPLSPLQNAVLLRNITMYKLQEKAALSFTISGVLKHWQQMADVQEKVGERRVDISTLDEDADADELSRHIRAKRAGRSLPSGVGGADDDDGIAALVGTAQREGRLRRTKSAVENQRQTSRKEQMRRRRKNSKSNAKARREKHGADDDE